MKNDTNIYDIDGKLLREAGNTEKLTLEEAQERVKYYQDLLKDLDPDDKKAEVYTTYIRNLSQYIMTLYSTMSPEEISSIIKKNSTEEQVNKALNELKEEINNENPEETPIEEPVEAVVSQDDLLVERNEEAPVMEEYVPFEEISE